MVGQFYDHGLLDEIIAQVGSVTLGSGKPLLPRAITKPPLRLISARAMGTGFAELRYEVPKINDGIPQPESGGGMMAQTVLVAKGCVRLGRTTVHFRNIKGATSRFDLLTTILAVTRWPSTGIRELRKAWTFVRAYPANAKKRYKALAAFGRLCIGLKSPKLVSTPIAIELAADVRGRRRLIR
jgi:hypothetical protein